MMYQTKHKHFNNQIKMLLLILMWSLMWRHVYGKSSTYDKDSTTESIVRATGTFNDDDDDDDDADGAAAQDMSTSTGETIMISTTTAASEGIINNNATIYDDINENDNNSNKLPQNVANQENRPTQTTEMMEEIIKPPPMEQAMMAKDQLNETDYEMMPVDSRNLSCRSQQKEENGLRAQKEDCDIAVTDTPANGNGTEDYDAQGSEEESLAEINEADATALMQTELIHKFAVKYKKIRRVTFFSCRRNCPKLNCDDAVDKSEYKYRRPTEWNIQTFKLLERLFSQGDAENPKKSVYSDLLVKVVEIDHLIVKRRSASNSPRQRGFYDGGNRKEDRGPGGSGGRTIFTNPNWLDQVLRPENYPQLVVVDMLCGNASRRLLEMASNKALFNSMYHWLLMEDYVFNRQTEIDDADDIKNKMNCSRTGSSGCGPTTSSSSGNSNSGYRNNTDKEVVNDSSKSAMLGKKLSFSTTDVVGASTSGSDKQYESRLLSRSAASPSLASVRTELVVDQRTSDRSGSGSSGGADEDDMEIIEKFLEKLNININTELILAKRRMRSISTTNSAYLPAQAVLPAPNPAVATESITMMPSVANSASLGSGDYNTLQKMDYYILYDVWNPGRQYGGELNISEVGAFSLQQGFWVADWYGQSAPVMRRLNMHLAQIRCLVVLTHKNSSDSLEEYLTSRHDPHLDSMHRYNFALLSHVRDLFNFSFILSKTSTWGYLKNGKFDGMIGALVRKQADIGGSPIFFRIERAKVIDYTTRTWLARNCFIFRHPRSTKKDRIVFLQPFSNDVWILLAACGIVTILLLWAMATLEPDGGETTSESEAITEQAIVPMFQGKGYKRRLVRWCGLFCGKNLDDSAKTQRAGLFLESILFYVGSICQQGLSFSTRSFSGRCIVVISLLFSFAIYQFYSASIVGTLLMEKPKTIRTLKDLIHSALEIGIEDIAYNRDYFLRTKDPVAQELYAKKVTAVPSTEGGFVDNTLDTIELVTQAPLTESQKAKAYRDILHSHETGAHAKTNDASNWYEPDYGVAKIKKGRFAFHVDVATAYKIIADTFTEKEICDLAEIQLFPPQKMVSILQKGSPLRKAITYGLRRVSEVGLMEYERKYWQSAKPRCVKTLHTDDLQVDLQTFTSALLVLLFGFVVSLMILSLEISHHRLWQQYATSATTTTETAVKA